MGTLAEGMWQEEKMTFKRAGFWQPYVTVRTAESQDDIARMDLHWLHDSTVIFRDGDSYRWRYRSMWHQEWEFVKTDGSPIVAFKTSWTMSGLRADITVGIGMIPEERIRLLIVFGFYLLASTYDSGGGETAVLIASIG